MRNPMLKAKTMIKAKTSKILTGVFVVSLILLSGCSSPQERSGIRTTPINRPAQWEKNTMPSVTF
jgi:hypothetical protein